MKRLLLVAAALLGCAKSEPAKVDEHPPMSTGERERAGTICTKYVERVCACAERDPGLKDACDLAKAQPEAVKMHLDVLEGAPLAELGAAGEVKPAAPTAGKRGPLNDNERRLTENSLRKVVAACVKLDSDLDLARCPRR